MQIAGIVIVLVGFLIGALNWVLFIRRNIRKGGPSAVPIVALVFVLLGSFTIGESEIKQYLWLILFIDFTALPMLLLLAYKSLREKSGQSSNT
ncbi:hypothetical protein [Thalassomonas actiniarum]|uniref:Uncharacterized protein n=1 Tax=Thalassomonas actiniarum TaxID=485447 RepID=A0AAF0C6S3_9GAMM|nr:hypothetical protein [Thalassomonas actiniarum]WDE02596.1 hypothetical protein SG35_029780 [Thalassomonas actiniarum]